MFSVKLDKSINIFNISSDISLFIRKICIKLVWSLRLNSCGSGSTRPQDTTLNVNSSGNHEIIVTSVEKLKHSVHL